MIRDSYSFASDYSDRIGQGRLSAPIVLMIR